MRWSLSALSACKAAEPLRGELRCRVSRLAAQITAAPLPLKLHPVRADLATCYSTAAEQLSLLDTSISSALAEVERGTANAVSTLRELPGARVDHSIQSLLQWGFDELLAQRVLTQARLCHGLLGTPQRPLLRHPASHQHAPCRGSATLSSSANLPASRRC